MIIGLFFNIFSVEHFSNVLHGQQRSALTSVEGMQSCRASLEHIFNIYIYKNIYNSTFQPHEVWTSVATDSAESWRTLHYAPQHPVTLLLILCGLPFHGWVTFVPNRFHFVIIPLTVDCGIFGSEGNSQLDLLRIFQGWGFVCFFSPSCYMVGNHSVFVYYQYVNSQFKRK